MSKPQPMRVHSSFPPPVGKVQPAAALSAQMRDAAETLAAQIEEGEFAALTPEQRCDLRGLPMALAGWSDRVETMEQERSFARAALRRHERGWGFVARLIRRLGCA